MHSTMVSARFYSLFVTFSLFLLTSTAQENITCLESIYQFGDSISDTGNLIRSGFGVGALTPAARFPYGVTFPGFPSGRWSDGRLIIDYITNATKLPLLNPYLERNASFNNGVNFAVAAGTAQNESFFVERSIITLNFLSSPLNVQIQWFEAYLNSTCNTTLECEAKLKRSLFIVGEIGANDMIFALIQGRSVQEIRTYVPLIVQAIVNAIREVIRLGAKRIVVPNSIPIGCFPLHLTLFPSADPNAYDEIGCLRNLNGLAELQNNLLRVAVNSLRQQYPNVVIIYSDYYAAFQRVLRLYTRFEERLTACCGIGGRYNFNPLLLCGTPGVPVCPNPSSYANWDGVHFTQETYRRVSNIVIPNFLSNIQCV